MADKRVIDYIKSQLSRGVSINQIKQNLLAQGWSYSSIDSAIDLAMQNNPGIKKHVSVSTIIGFIIIILASSVMIFFLAGGADLLKTLTTTPETPNNPPPQTESSQIIDCGANFDCFINASENCEKAKFQTAGTIELFGMLITTAGYSELKGMESDKCIYYTKTINQTIEFSNEFVQQMLSEGTTQEEIDQQEQSSNEEAKLAWGLDGTCKFNMRDLTSLLNEWKAGNSSTEDFAVAECEGAMFDTQNFSGEGEGFSYNVTVR